MISIVLRVRESSVERSDKMVITSGTGAHEAPQGSGDDGTGQDAPYGATVALHQDLQLFDDMSLWPLTVPIVFYLAREYTSDGRGAPQVRMQLPRVSYFAMHVNVVAALVRESMAFRPTTHTCVFYSHSGLLGRGPCLPLPMHVPIGILADENVGLERQVKGVYTHNTCQGRPLPWRIEVAFVPRVQSGVFDLRVAHEGPLRTWHNEQIGQGGSKGKNGTQDKKGNDGEQGHGKDDEVAESTDPSWLEAQLPDTSEYVLDEFMERLLSSDLMQVGKTMKAVVPSVLETSGQSHPRGHGDPVTDSHVADTSCGEAGEKAKEATGGVTDDGKEGEASQPQGGDAVQDEKIVDSGAAQSGEPKHAREAVRVAEAGGRDAAASKEKEGSLASMTRLYNADVKERETYQQQAFPTCGDFVPDCHAALDILRIDAGVPYREFATYQLSHCIKESAYVMNTGDDNDLREAVAQGAVAEVCKLLVEGDLKCARDVVRRLVSWKRFEQGTSPRIVVDGTPLHFLPDSIPLKVYDMDGLLWRPSSASEASCDSGSDEDRYRAWEPRVGAVPPLKEAFCADHGASLRSVGEVVEMLLDAYVIDRDVQSSKSDDGGVVAPPCAYGLVALGVALPDHMPLVAAWSIAHCADLALHVHIKKNNIEKQ